MMRSLRKHVLKVALVALLFFLVMPAIALAVGEVPQGPDWGGVIAIGINAVLVVVVTEFLKLLVPRLSPAVKRVLALVSGPSLMALAAYLSGVLGHPIDLTPWIMVLTGVGSVPLALGLFDTVGRVTVKPVRKAVERAIGRAA